MALHSFLAPRQHWDRSTFEGRAGDGERERERQRASKALLLQMLIIHEAGKNAGGILILGQMAALMTLRLWQLDHLATLKEVVYVYAQLWDDRKFEMYWAALWKDASSLLGLLNSVSQFLWQI